MDAGSGGGVASNIRRQIAMEGCRQYLSPKSYGRDFARYGGDVRSYDPPPDRLVSAIDSHRCTTMSVAATSSLVILLAVSIATASTGISDQCTPTKTITLDLPNIN